MLACNCSTINYPDKNYCADFLFLLWSCYRFTRGRLVGWTFCDWKLFFYENASICHSLAFILTVLSLGRRVKSFLSSLWFDTIRFYNLEKHILILLLAVWEQGHISARSVPKYYRNKNLNIMMFVPVWLSKDKKKKVQFLQSWKEKNPKLLICPFTKDEEFTELCLLVKKIKGLLRN